MIEDTGINRNIMECKAAPVYTAEEYARVLIETLWNVKQLPVYDTMEGHDFVLIETLWNVKQVFTDKVNMVWHCINRNIMECKGTRSQMAMAKPHRINRNIMECKAKDSTGALKKQNVLIETLWNVKTVGVGRSEGAGVEY